MHPPSPPPVLPVSGAAVNDDSSVGGVVDEAALGVGDNDKNYQDLALISSLTELETLIFGLSHDAPFLSQNSHDGEVVKMPES